MKTREDLLSELNDITKKLEKFRCPEYDGIYSKQYYNDILLNMFSHNNKKFSYIFGDINKLGTINKIYGHDQGDKVIDIFIAILKEKLPQNALISRLGGDEFSIILPDVDSSTAKKYINNINETLKEKSNITHDLSVTFSVKDSTVGNITELANLTEKAVSNKKTARQKHDNQDEISFDDFIKLDIPKGLSKENLKKWKKFNSLLNVSTYNFLQNLRPSNSFSFEQKQLTDSSAFITSAYNYLLNKKNDSKIRKDSDYDFLSNEPIFPEEEYNFCNIDLFNNLNPKIASAIHSLIGNNVNLNDTSNNAIKNAKSIMNSLINDLVRTQNTIFLSKPYFRLYLAEELSKFDKNYQAVFFSTSGIKLSNTAHDHSFTDVRLSKTADLFYEAFLKCRNFNNNPFECSQNDTYLINHGAGDFLALLPVESSMSENEINNILKYVNSFSDIKDPYSSFMMTADYKNRIDKSSRINFIKSVRDLKDSTNLKKDELKKMLFNSTDFLIAFYKTFNNSMDYYFNNIKNSESDFSEQTLILKNIFKSFLNFESLHNEHSNSNFINTYKANTIKNSDSDQLEK